MQASGEVLGDFLGLAKVAMAAGGEGWRRTLPLSW